MQLMSIDTVKPHSIFMTNIFNQGYLLPIIILNNKMPMNHQTSTISIYNTELRCNNYDTKSFSPLYVYKADVTFCTLLPGSKERIKFKF